jgi:hypothetical protein
MLFLFLINRLFLSKLLGNLGCYSGILLNPLPSYSKMCLSAPIRAGLRYRLRRYFASNFAFNPMHSSRPGQPQVAQLLASADNDIALGTLKTFAKSIKYRARFEIAYFNFVHLFYSFYERVLI